MERRKKRQEDDPEAMLKELMKLEANIKCADCGAHRPRYASITLGVFLCNRCYGIHRSVGAHVSRTKSISLDNWSSLDVTHMCSVGNARASSYWLRNLPSDYKTPSALSPDHEIEKWIRDKYERRLFCDQGPPPEFMGQQLSQPVVQIPNLVEDVNSEEWSPFVSAS